jgi:hypothetical protein
MLMQCIPEDFQAIEEARTDSVPDDGYGFHNVDIRKDRH